VSHFPNALLVVVAALLLQAAAAAQEGPRSVLFPAPVAPWSLSSSVGATVTVLPRPIAEEEIRQIPMLDIGLRFAVPFGGSIVAGVSSNVIASSAALGAQWSYAIGKYSVAVGDRFSFWYGATQIEGFDASARGWMNHPYVTLGADYKELRVLLRAELTYVLSRSERVGDEVIATDDSYRAGAAFTAAIEQRFIDSTDVTFGVRLNITDSAVQSWLAFSTFRDRLVFPELFFAVIL
jgi:hypothetical protein